MKKSILCAGLAITLLMSACNDDTLDAITTVDSSFETSADGWASELAEYSTETDTATIQFRSGRTNLPAGLDVKKFAYMLQAQNRSDDMFMYLKKKITGLVPNGTYSVVFDLDLATKYSEGAPGAGGSPSSSVYIKAGASPVEPAKKLVNKFYEFTLDKGQQANEGKDAVLLGNASNGLEEEKYAIVKRSNADKPFTVKVNAQGELWLFIGSDSGFEGLNTLYFDRAKVTIKEVAVN
ncbi:hypothetical protein [Dyadobacter sp. CY323]|uniref:hypothetical protein n=1 Tax=Dyadobacter sp. CY323 TaxID=2907302 RepID=UPI001F3B84C7|nr:hypothetical protein [Dyadobacter sp. CY323]MCE6991636.1 hypothetical protein [Dyadobacter sp. CY323]